MRPFALVVVWLSGLCFLGFGVAFLIAPLATLAAAGLVLEGALAATELRAFYGGLELALGAVIVACALRPERLRDGLWLTLVSYGGIGAARLASMLLTGADTPFLRFAAATEVAFALAAIVALRGLRAGPR